MTVDGRQSQHADKAVLHCYVFHHKSHMDFSQNGLFVSNDFLTDKVIPL